MEAASRDSHATWVTVVNEDRSGFDLGMQRDRDAADIAAVTDHQERHERDGSMLGGVQGTHEMATAVTDRLLERPRSDPPETHCLELDRW